MCEECGPSQIWVSSPPMCDTRSLSESGSWVPFSRATILGSADQPIGLQRGLLQRLSSSACLSWLMGEHLPGGQATSSLGDQATWLKEILHQADEKTVKVKSRLMTYTKLYIIYIYIHTWNPFDLCFDRTRPKRGYSGIFLYVSKHL